MNILNIVKNLEQQNKDNKQSPYHVLVNDIIKYDRSYTRKVLIEELTKLEAEGVIKMVDSINDTIINIL